MTSVLRFSRCLLQHLPGLLFLFSLNSTLSAQKVDVNGCPSNYFRNNGNGQSVSVFAPNIVPESIYFQSALTSGNTGNFTFKWEQNLLYPPVINKTWITSADGITTQNWIFGNNTSGSPFNPPGVPDAGQVKYTFYNNNLPTAGTITLELTDPSNGAHVNTCSYPLSNGSNSSGTLVSLAVSPPTDFYYPDSSSTFLYGMAGSSVEPNINTGGGTITFELETQVSGISINSKSGVLSWGDNVAIGVYALKINASNGLQPDAKATFYLTIAESGIVSGLDGGLESKSLGTAVAERLYNATISGDGSNKGYGEMEKVSASISLYNLEDIRQFMPDEHALGSGFTGYITSPKDILSFTNAVDVLSVDYVAGGINQAVAFCTKTLNGVYTHTKPVCDRLKGSELLRVDTLAIGKYRFLQYQLKPAKGLTEYAISFSVGSNENDSKIVLQSEWITDSYSAHGTMFNFQLWSAEKEVLHAMLSNILNKLANEMPVQQQGQVKLPAAYITRAARSASNQHQLLLQIRNLTQASSGQIFIEGKANEQSGNSIAKSYPVSLQPHGESTVSIPLQDMAEAEIRLSINGITEDFVYSNDGIWNIYKTPDTQVREFIISNDTIQPKEDEYRLFRNVKIQATTSDYVTVYRMVKGGGMPSDLSAFKRLRFTASGNGNMRIRLIKKSVTNYSEQYEYVLPLSETLREYSINTDQFKSAATATPLTMDDIVVVSFTYEVAAPSTRLSATLQQVRFAKKEEIVAPSVKPMLVYPNPAHSHVNLVFESKIAETIPVTLTHISSGKQVQVSSAAVVKGDNIINISLPATLPKGVYLMRVHSTSQPMANKIMIL